MHDAHMKMMARILGEIYRIQNAIEGMPRSASGSQVYGLLNGFEVCIDMELEQSESISKEKLNAAADVLSEIFYDGEKLDKFRGFYQIEDELTSRGIDRIDAIKMLTYWQADGRFKELIEKMNSEDSPVECRTFELHDYER